MWTVRATGNMTLSVLNESDTQIFKVDMLKQNIMKAETNGFLLARMLNSLFVISQFSESRIIDDILAELPYPEYGIFSLPWECKYQPEKRIFSIKYAKGILCNRKFPYSFDNDDLEKIVEIVESGISQINYLSLKIKDMV